VGRPRRLVCLGKVNSIDAKVIERDYPDIAARFADLHDGGKHAGFWRELIAQIVDNNRVSPSWTPDDLRQIRCPTLLIAGEDDPFANTEQMVVMKTGIPGRRVADRQPRRPCRARRAARDRRAEDRRLPPAPQQLVPQSS
jgi:pimeloyl-ACP methyl ester carboxylesterase